MWRLKSSFLALLISLFACTLAFAQRAGPGAVIEVHVSYTNDRPAGQQIQVDLLNGQSVSMAKSFTDSEGRAEFQVGRGDGGTFRVQASGADIETAISDTITLNAGDRKVLAWVYVQPKPAAAGSASSSSGTKATTTANELRIPDDARKHFLKGMEALNRHDYPKAAESFQKAVAAYPQYDAAYDNLGVTYMQVGQPAKARAAFERAVELNDKNADADRNYARLLLANKENARAIELLTQALSIEPQDPASLTLLSVAQLRTGDVDAALQNALKVQQLPHENYALARIRRRGCV